MAVTEETEAQVRELREKAVEYADSVAAGEEPWKDEEADVNDSDSEEAPPSPKNDDVGEIGEPGDEVIEVEQDTE